MKRAILSAIAAAMGVTIAVASFALLPYRPVRMAIYEILRTKGTNVVTLTNNYVAGQISTVDVYTNGQFSVTLTNTPP